MRQGGVSPFSSTFFSQRAPPPFVSSNGGVFAPLPPPRRSKREAEGLLRPTQPSISRFKPRGWFAPTRHSKQEMEGGICTHLSPLSLISRGGPFAPSTYMLFLVSRYRGPLAMRDEGIYAHHPPPVSCSEGGFCILN